VAILAKIINRVSYKSLLELLATRTRRKGVVAVVELGEMEVMFQNKNSLRRDYEIIAFFSIAKWAQR